MTGRVVNLRTRRKQKARDDSRKRASEVAPGVSRLERHLAEAENRRARERLEQHRMEGSKPGEPAPDEA